MAEKMTDELRARLTEWQTKYNEAKADYGEELTKMDAREAWYRGDQAREPLFSGDVVTGKKTVDVPLCRNVCAEMIEDQIDVTIPAPKVTARRKEDEEKARLIENMLRNKIDLLPFERIEDLLDRVVKIQGGAAYLVEWDSSVRCGDSMGELCVTPIHPKNLIPQPGVVTSIEDMDYVFVRTPSTRSAVERRFGVVLDETETESEPEARTSEGESRDNDLVTIITAYYRSGDAEKTGIGKFSWVNDTVLEDYEDYQARRLRRCAKCGAPEGVRFGSPNAPTVDLANALGLGLPGEDVSGVPGTPGELPGEGAAVVPAEAAKVPFGISRYAEVEEGVCPVCGSTDFVEGDEDYEEIWETVTLDNDDGDHIFPGAHRPGRHLLGWRDHLMDRGR